MVNLPPTNKTQIMCTQLTIHLVVFNLEHADIIISWYIPYNYYVLIEKLEEELEEFKKALSTLYTDVQVLFSVEL